MAAGSTGHEVGGESAGDRQWREAAEATVGSSGDGQGVRERDSSGHMGEGGCWSGSGERSVVEEEEAVVVRRLEGEELHRHMVGEQDSGEEGRAVRGETGMARVSIAPRPLGERRNRGRVGRERQHRVKASLMEKASVRGCVGAALGG